MGAKLIAPDSCIPEGQGEAIVLQVKVRCQEIVTSPQSPRSQTPRLTSSTELNATLTTPHEIYMMPAEQFVVCRQQ